MNFYTGMIKWKMHYCLKSDIMLNENTYKHLSYSCIAWAKILIQLIG